MTQDIGAFQMIEWRTKIKQRPNTIKPQTNDQAEGWVATSNPLAHLFRFASFNILEIVIKS